MKYNIDRFIRMQEQDYDNALNEIKNGKKISHWIWYIFPQLKGLGSSKTSEYYGISNLEEAKEFLNNEYLKTNIIEICNELYKLDNDIEYIFGYPDYLKVKSSMTLFSIASNEKIFNDILDKFYNGKKDEYTLKKLNIK